MQGVVGVRASTYESYARVQLDVSNLRFRNIVQVRVKEVSLRYASFNSLAPAKLILGHVAESAQLIDAETLAVGDQVVRTRSIESDTVDSKCR